MFEQALDEWELWSCWSQDIRVSKALNLDEVHWGIRVGKVERSGPRTEVLRHSRLRGEDEEDTASLRRTREGGRKWCPGAKNQDVSGRSEMSESTSQVWYCTVTPARTIPDRGWGCSVDLTDSRRRSRDQKRQPFREFLL